jgi:hypothetical protein
MKGAAWRRGADVLVAWRKRRREAEEVLSPVADEEQGAAGRPEHEELRRLPLSLYVREEWSIGLLGNPNCAVSLPPTPRIFRFPPATIDAEASLFFRVLSQRTLSA